MYGSRSRLYLIENDDDDDDNDDYDDDNDLQTSRFCIELYLDNI